MPMSLQMKAAGNGNPFAEATLRQRQLFQILPIILR